MFEYFELIKNKDIESLMNLFSADAIVYEPFRQVDGIKIKKPGGLKSRITGSDKEIILSALFNDPHIFGYLRNTWSLRSLARCLTDELDIPISFKHLQRITKDMGIRCTRPKLELLHGEDYEQGKKRVDNYKHVASALKKREL